MPRKSKPQSRGGQRGRARQASSGSVSKTPASDVQPSNDSITYPKTLVNPTLNPIALAAFKRDFPEIYGNIDMDKPIPPHVRPPAPPDGLGMLDAVHGSFIDTPSIRAGQPVPHQLQVQLPEDGCVCPTHIIACPPEGKKKTYTLFVVHSNVFEANCTSLPVPFPPSSVASNSSATLEQPVLPVVTYNLPSAKAFLAIQTWLYLKNDMMLYEMVAPSNRALWFTSYAGAECQLEFLYGMWRNACYLGIIDMTLYAAIRAGWTEAYATRSTYSR